MNRWTLRAAFDVPLSPGESVHSWAPVLVLAPHPDDEALGCGGVISLLRNAGLRVEIAWLTDGRGSHRGSRAFPPEKLIALRREEALASAKALGVESMHFFELEDARVPSPPCERTVARLREILRGMRTVLTPWRLDPHCDHRAAFDYVSAAAAGSPVRIIEIPIWVWENGAPEDHPARDEFSITRIAIDDVLPQKRAAIAAHRSQVTNFITDDPSGFRVPLRMLEHFQQPWELFLSTK